MSNDFTPAGTKRTRKEQTAQVAAPSKTPLQSVQVHPADAEPVYPQDDWVARRTEEIRKKRSERTPTTIDAFNQKLSIPEDRKDPRLVYRWVLDTGTRIHDLRARDWEVAPGDVTAGDPRDMGVGTVSERMGNTRTVPKPEKHVLMCKPKVFHEADAGKKLAKIKAHEDEMKRGKSRSPDDETGAAGDGFYVPQGGIKIGPAG